MRTHQCGELRAEHIGSDRHPRAGGSRPAASTATPLAFVDVRDHTGVTQCVVDNSVDVRAEYVVRVTGVVAARPAENVNDRLPTGEIEIQECEVEVLNVAEPPPFPISERADTVAENTRLQYRYLDIRRERMQRNLRIRSAANSAIRAGDGGAGLRRGRDADAGAVARRRAPASSSCPAASSRARSTPCRRARSCSSSC